MQHALLARKEEQVPADYLEGRSLDKYRILEPLGRGGMARVYRAYHPQLDRYVAVKVLRSDLAGEKEFLARFQREARAVAALRHPNIVQVFDFDVKDDIYYMVMELLEGDSLRTRLNDYRVQGERLPLGEALRIIMDVLDALAYAHSEGMIHRDVKPANILLTRGGQAVLSDFGIAQIIGGTRLTVSGALMGTLAYMAPEQGMEGKCDARSDLYSLGIVLYEMLTGDPPFDAETPLAILMKHVNDPLPLPRKVDPSIPRPLERVILKTLAKRPQQRYQTALEMAQALEHAARRARIDLPNRVSLPMSFTTAQDPSESVAVLSGTARQRVRDQEFATGDTDAQLSQRLEREASGLSMDELSAAWQAEQDVPDGPPEKRAPGQALQPEADRPKSSQPQYDGAQASRELSSAVGAAAANIAEAAGSFAAGAAEAASAAAAQAVRSSFQRVSYAQHELPATTRESRGSVGRAILLAFAMVVAGNLLAVMLGGFSGRWGVYSRGWPFELLLVGLGLGLITDTLGRPWLLAPTGIVLGHGVLFSFYALTNWWSAWSILWPLELVVLFAPVLLSLWLSRQGQAGRDATRMLARLASRITMVLIPLVMLAGAVLG